jgi:predicted nuclease of restriction endonuclease-like (RecB) superfamily
VTLRTVISSGVGFAFVGRQVPLDVDGEEFFIDLLFFHIPLFAEAEASEVKD